MAINENNGVIMANQLMAIMYQCQCINNVINNNNINNQIINNQYQ